MINENLNGFCHCEKVRWKYSLPLESVTACNCTVCRRYGTLWAYGYENEGVQLSGSSKFYSRGNKNIEFHFCDDCGCVAAWRSSRPNEKGKKRLAVNLRMIDDPNLIASLPIDHFDGFDKFDDEPRDHRCVKDLWY